MFTEVKVGNNVFLNPIGEIFTPFRAPDKTVL